jgi:hypothetical protein
LTIILAGILPNQLTKSGNHSAPAAFNRCTNAAHNIGYMYCIDTEISKSVAYSATGACQTIPRTPLRTHARTHARFRIISHFSYICVAHLFAGHKKRRKTR